MTKHAARWVGVVALALVGGCGSEDPTDLASGPRALVEQALEHWRAVGPASYEYQIVYLCTGCEPGPGSFDVTVEEGAVVAAVHSETGAPLTGPTRDAIRSIDGLFEQILAFMDADPASAAVQFHSTLGYPTQIFIAAAGDDAGQDWGFRIESLETAP